MLETTLTVMAQKDEDEASKFEVHTPRVQDPSKFGGLIPIFMDHYTTGCIAEINCSVCPFIC